MIPERRGARSGRWPLLLLPWLAAAAMGLFATPAAQAQQISCSDGCTETLPDCCGGRCSNLRVSPANCGACGRQCPAGQVCDGGECVVPGPPGGQCEPACGPDELCVGPLGERFCCRRDHLCRGVCLSGPAVKCGGGGSCCAPDQSCCGASGCCPADAQCCGGSACCTATQSCCGDSCCNSGEVCLPGSPFRDAPYPCCPQEQVCGGACCGPGRECVDGTCRPRCAQGCGPGSVCIPVPDFELGTPTSCCPEEDAWDLLQNGVWVSTSCCPAEMRWEHTQGYVENVPECCAPEDRWVRPWRDTTVGECCPLERRCGEKCCPDELPHCDAGVCRATPPTAAAPPWLGPNPGCTPQAATMYVTGIMLDMTTGEAKCERSLVVCGDSLSRKVHYDSSTSSCPFASGRRAAIAYSVEMPPVCCESWEAARETGQPCDPLADADCDGIPNDEDVEPLTPAPLPPTS